MDQIRLPLWDRVIFVDWHGVLSNDPYWASVLDGKPSQLSRRLRGRLATVFAEGTDLSDRWMRGTVETLEIIEPLRSSLGNRRRDDFLERRLLKDMRSMRVDERLTLVLAALRAQNLLVLATDNIDDFLRAFRAARRTADRAKSLTDSPASRLAELTLLFDDILCSSGIGVLKQEDPQRFFGEWLERHSVRFSNAILVDDRTDNCDAFRSLGGTAICWPGQGPDRENALENLAELVAR